MFWSGNYIVRELNSLLRDEDVDLNEILDADDILQECQANNKDLIEFLTCPEILEELIRLITEEPPKYVELQYQYRHAYLACEVLTSRIATLSDKLSSDVVQMNRICDFINKEPPLNPLLASFFSKTVEMLLDRSSKQDWYLYHIVCIRVLHFFKSRREFLPNLLRHLSTSAIAGTFKYFIRLDDQFNKVMEWFEEHQFLESLIQILCGTYIPEELQPCVLPLEETPERQNSESTVDAQQKDRANHNEEVNNEEDKGSTNGEEAADAPTPKESGDSQAEREREREARAGRMRAVASDNAATLLCDIISMACAEDSCNARPRTGVTLMTRLKSEEMVSLQLQSMFTSPPAFRRHALVNGSRVLLVLLDQDPILGGGEPSGGGGGGGGSGSGSGEPSGGGSGGGGGESSGGGSEAACGSRSAVELAVAPHLPLLHQALLQEPEPEPAAAEAAAGARVGAARLQVCALVAALAASEVQEVATTLVTLGTPGTLVRLMFAHPHNNFLHAAALAAVRAALANEPYRQLYAAHLLVECDLLTQLMDAFEENENKTSGAARCAYMGHVVQMLAALEAAMAGPLAERPALPTPLRARWDAFREQKLQPLLYYHNTPLGGYYPSEKTYEFNETATASGDDYQGDITSDINDLGDLLRVVTKFGGNIDEYSEKYTMAKDTFMQLAENERCFGDDMWNDDGPAEDEGRGAGEEAEGEEAEGEEAEAPADDDAAVEAQAHQVLAAVSPWEAHEAAAGAAGGGAGGGGGEGWARFGDGGAAGGFGDGDFDAFWAFAYDGGAAREPEPDEAATAELTNNLLTAMSSMTPEVIANIVNANMPPAEVAAGEEEAREEVEAQAPEEPREEVVAQVRKEEAREEVVTQVSEEEARKEVVAQVPEVAAREEGEARPAEEAVTEKAQVGGEAAAR